MNVTDFLEKHFRHFNARELLAAARSYRDFVSGPDGGRMMVTLAGAMSTGELGISLAEMIREGKVHAITCTAANLEEDIFNLVANGEYRMSKIGVLFLPRTKSDCVMPASIELRTHAFQRQSCDTLKVGF